MRFLKLILFVAFFYFIYGFIINQFEINVSRGKSSVHSNDGLFDYRGVINVSSKLSIGSSDFSQIIKSAEKAGLDFIMFTDLNTFSDSGFHSSYQEGILTLVGSKYSYLDSRIIHYSSKEKNLGSTLGDVQIGLADIITKRPLENKDQLTILTQPKTPAHSWQGDLPSGIDGIEILNSKSIATLHWTKNKLSIFWSLLIYPFNSRLALLRLFIEPEEEVDFWDTQLKLRPVNAFAGSEATAKAIPFSGYLIKFPSYLRSFELVSNHVLLNSELTGNFENDKKKIFNALKNGHFYLAVDALGNPNGFNAIIENKKNTYLMGSRLELTKDLFLKVTIPEIKNVFYEIVVIKDGVKIKTFNSLTVEMPLTEKGTYRI
ncbi:MAG TPA: hypothetical protein PLJ21_11560, partial [Pseudobdellovibrionaceae bacterium]|nr:hypothetical protein [Pseudobdellovibrionaceae bacterium]